MTQFSQQQAFVQNVLLMGLETGFSWLIYHDPLLKNQVQKFVEQKTVIKINNYLPLFDVYIQFTPQGVLFDATAPVEQKIDLEVRVTPILLFKILILGEARALRQLRIKGDVELKDQFHDLLLLCTLPKMIADVPRWLFSGNTQHSEKQNFSQSRITPMLETLAKQRDEIRKLKATIKSNEYRQQKMIKQNRNLKILSALLAFILLIFIVLYSVN